MSVSPEATFAYKLILRVGSSQSRSYTYTIHLTESEENIPLPRLQNEAQDIRLNLQRQGLQRLSTTDLQKLLKNWAEEIKLGYQNVNLTLELSPVEFDVLDQVHDTGCPPIPVFTEPSLEGIKPHLALLPPLQF